MTAGATTTGAAAADGTPVVVDIVVPVYNEQAVLEANVVRLRRYVDELLPFPAVVTVVDNASTDRTRQIAIDLAHRLPGLRVMALDRKGRGRALRAAWSTSPAKVVAYMDVDLSTGLEALLPLVAPLVSGHSDLSIGTRLAPGSRVVRGAKREVISRGYNLLVRGALGNGFTDAQCGFKALRAETARDLLPLVRDNDWFFDTELLALAERNGLRIHEVPVDWVDDPDSRVDIRQTAVADLRGLAGLVRRFQAGEGWIPIDNSKDPRDAKTQRRPPSRRELSRMAGVGVATTVAFVVLFVLLRPALGVWGADVVSLALCTLVNVAAHARLGRGDANAATARSRVLGGVAVLLVNAALTLLALGVAQGVAPGSLLAQVVAVVLATLVAGVLRLVAIQAWWPVFNHSLVPLQHPSTPAATRTDAAIQGGRPTDGEPPQLSHSSTTTPSETEPRS